MFVVAQAGAALAVVAVYSQQACIVAVLMAAGSVVGSVRSVFVKVVGIWVAGDSSQDCNRLASVETDYMSPPLTWTVGNRMSRSVKHRTKKGELVEFASEVGMLELDIDQQSS